MTNIVGSEKREMAGFDATRAVEAIRERIRAALADVIPDEQWDALIRAEVKDYLEDRTVEYDYSRGMHQTVPAGFKRVVREELTIETKKRLKDIFNGPEWNGRWSSDGSSRELASEAVKKIIIESSSEIVSTVLSDAVQKIISNMRHGL